MKIWIVFQYQSRREPKVIIGVYCSKKNAEKKRDECMPDWRSIEQYTIKES